MRIIIAFVAFCLGVSTSLAQEPVAHATNIVGLFEKLYYSPKELKRCTAYLRATLSDLKPGGNVSDLDILRADQRLRDAGCLDEYSTLRLVIPSGGASGGARTGAPVASAEVHGARLFMRIDSFFGSHETLSRALALIDAERLAQVKRVVVDLRGNPGGSIPDLARVLDGYFSPRRGVTYQRATGSERYGEKSIKTTRQGIFAGKHITMLSDKRSASAAEWLMATIRYEWYRKSSSILGEKTYGKAIAQCSRHVAGTGVVMMKLTCGEWYLRRRVGGRVRLEKVQGKGIVPDKAITFPACKRDYACIAKEMDKLGI